MREEERHAMNRVLDMLARTRLPLLGGSASAFRLAGCAGLVAAAALSAILVASRGLSLALAAALLAASALTFVGLALVERALLGQERLVYYHHAIAVLATSALLLRVLGRPVLAYLDIVALGLGTFLSFGRGGCLMVGCCHGRPHRWGIRYGEDHAREGFYGQFVGIRLFPVQGVEAIWTGAVVATGSALVLDGSPPGSALSCYVVLYAAGRLVLERGRGDPGRPEIGGVSEAQWISLLALAAVALAEARDLLPRHLGHVAVALAAPYVMLGLRRDPLFHAGHVAELAALVDQLSLAVEPGDDTGAARVAAGSTSLGVQVSASVVAGREGRMTCYMLSQRSRTLSLEHARALARVIRDLRQPMELVDLATRRPGQHYLLLRAPTPGAG
jgi:hypothetical protein